MFSIEELKLELNIPVYSTVISEKVFSTSRMQTLIEAITFQKLNYCIQNTTAACNIATRRHISQGCTPQIRNSDHLCHICSISPK